MLSGGRRSDGWGIVPENSLKNVLPQIEFSRIGGILLKREIAV